MGICAPAGCWKGSPNPSWDSSGALLPGEGVGVVVVVIIALVVVVVTVLVVVVVVGALLRQGRTRLLAVQTATQCCQSCVFLGHMSEARPRLLLNNATGQHCVREGAVQGTASVAANLRQCQHSSRTASGGQMQSCTLGHRPCQDVWQRLSPGGA